MSEMVEWVARDMFVAHNRLRPHDDGMTWEKDAVDWEKNEYRAMARAAIAAVRDYGLEWETQDLEHLIEKALK
jgi:hypothetical protein